MWANQQATCSRDLMLFTFIWRHAAYLPSSPTPKRTDNCDHYRPFKGFQINQSTNEYMNWGGGGGLTGFRRGQLFLSSMYSLSAMAKCHRKKMKRRFGTKSLTSILQNDPNSGREFLLGYQTEDSKSLDRSLQTTCSCPILTK